MIPLRDTQLTELPAFFFGSFPPEVKHNGLISSTWPLQSPTRVDPALHFPMLSSCQRGYLQPCTQGWYLKDQKPGERHLCNSSRSQQDACHCLALVAGLPTCILVGTACRPVSPIPGLGERASAPCLPSQPQGLRAVH